MTYPGALRRRGPRVCAKVVWAALAGVCVWLATVGLGASFYVENTPEALASERRGTGLVLVACVLLIGLVVAAWLALDAPVWAVVVLSGLAAVLLLASGSGGGFWLIPVPFLAVPAGAVGVLWLPRSRRRSGEEAVSLD